jgi:hypothetical protein
MRLWSVHPKHLDAKGLLALWREGLLALAVLKGKTKGYKNHPQLDRFRAQPDPVASIQSFLLEVLSEAKLRGYHFDKKRLGHLRTRVGSVPKIPVTSGQLAFEAVHLLRKLEMRSPQLAHGFEASKVETHVLFVVVSGPVEQWERI